MKLIYGISKKTDSQPEMFISCNLLMLKTHPTHKENKQMDTADKRAKTRTITLGIANKKTTTKKAPKVNKNNLPVL